ncbi:hypothetical protein HK104_004934, partial [Borealophlyctis nickersoniae]
NSYRSQEGAPGGGKQKHGANGRDLEIVLPVGTIVRQVDVPMRSSPEKDAEEDEELDSGWGPYERELTDEEREDIRKRKLEEMLRTHFKFRSGYFPQDDRVQMLLERIMETPKAYEAPRINLDLMEHEERHLIIRGGSGGYGNPHFMTPEIRGPGIASRGSPGRAIYLELELKSIADVGLVGMPNAGKSTFLGAVSNAHPRIAPYPFTTLNPYIGTIDYPDAWTMTIADIPGLIEGAHRNRGLGHRFLRHVERNDMLAYVIDLSGPAPWKDLEILKKELELYKPGLTKRPSLVIANKADLGGTSTQRNLEILKNSTRDVVVPCSAKEGKNVTAVTGVMRQIVTALRRRKGVQ